MRFSPFAAVSGRALLADVWCVGTSTPPTVDIAPDVFGLVATCCGSGNEEDVSPYGVPIVLIGMSEFTAVDFEDCVLLAVVPL